ncbi:MAG: hypothetical protein GTN80_03495 [Nitrososphaeria archaeon]|nr:hypothetical protein [Nitrososphaeria archaeon]NIN52240.1 hypothetical protein [Nitrososphaeria archaeon]NIQ32696.1 hypothetical protein [Nitrososphaeria archaeon]
MFESCGIKPIPVAYPWPTNTYGETMKGYPKIGMFDILSRDELYSIHVATLELLEKVGVMVDNEKALTLFLEAGAEVDPKTKIVRIPQYLVEEAIKWAPRSILFAGRDRRLDLRLEGRRVYFGLGGGFINIIDLDGKRRPAGKGDIIDAVRLADALPNIDFVMPCFSYNTPHIGLHELDVMLRNTEKPLVCMDYGDVDVIRYIELASVVVGGETELRKRPILCMYVEPISPLTHGDTHTENLMTFARANLPIVPVPCPIMGATIPASLAGAIVQGSAETLSGNVIIQLTSKGAPVIFGASNAIMDMKAQVRAVAGPEYLINNLAIAQLGRYYGLPTWSSGGVSTSKVLDGQAYIEMTISLFVAAASGANLIHDVGLLERGITGCLDVITICDELASMFRRFLDGVNVTDETLALDLMAKVGPGGSYLVHEHTRDHVRREHWFPTLIDRHRWERWMAEGSKDLSQRVNEKTREILQTHTPRPLSKDIEERLTEIIREVERGRRV